MLITFKYQLPLHSTLLSPATSASAMHFRSIRHCCTCRLASGNQPVSNSAFVSSLHTAAVLVTNWPCHMAVFVLAAGQKAASGVLYTHMCCRTCPGSCYACNFAALHGTDEVQLVQNCASYSKMHTLLDVFILCSHICQGQPTLYLKMHACYNNNDSNVMLKSTIVAIHSLFKEQKLLISLFNEKLDRLGGYRE